MTENNSPVGGRPQWKKNIGKENEKVITYLDLVPPVPDGTLGYEISPPVSIVGSSPCTMPS